MHKCAAPFRVFCLEFLLNMQWYSTEELMFRVKYVDIPKYTLVSKYTSSVFCDLNRFAWLLLLLQAWISLDARFRSWTSIGWKAAVGVGAGRLLNFLLLFWAWEGRSDWPGRSDAASKHTMGLWQSWEGAQAHKRCLDETKFSEEK